MEVVLFLKGLLNKSSGEAIWCRSSGGQVPSVFTPPDGGWGKWKGRDE
jgi:hypothetical protein